MNCYLPRGFPRRTAAILKQNITIALGIKAVFIAMTVAGSATMWMAVFADPALAFLGGALDG